MSGTIEAWPPVDLISGLSLEAPPVETELDPNVLKGKSYAVSSGAPQAPEKLFQIPNLLIGQQGYPKAPK